MVRLALGTLLIALGAAQLAAQEAVAVVVHADVADTPGVADVRRIFLLRQRLWGDGTPIVVVNQSAGAPVRERFSVKVLGAPSRRFAAYWNDLYFHGTSPPPALASDQAVLLFVARTSGSIGYVSAAASRNLPPRVRLLLVLGDVNPR